MVDGKNLELEASHTSVYGRCGGPAIGFDVKISFSDGQAAGRLGGELLEWMSTAMSQTWSLS